MRREHFIKQSYIDWLRSLGCFVYMPLGENDFTEYISGNIATATGYGSYSWDSDVGMYEFCSPNTNQFPNGALSVPINYTKRKNEITILSKIRAPKSTGKPNCGGIGLLYNTTLKYYGGCDAKNSSNSPTSYCPNWVIHNTPFYHAWVINTNGNNSNYCAQEGTPYWSNVYDYINVYQSGVNQSYNKLNIAQSYSSSQTGAYQNYNGSYYYISDLMIFDAALDLATIRKIQGYE